VRQKTLGRTGLAIGPFALGCVTFGREIDEESSYRVMDYAVEKGITFFDTSQNYGGGQSRRARREMCGVDDRREVTVEMSSSEAVIGRWLRKRGGRDRITVCSKVWSVDGPESISEALDATLERLGTGHVEIYKLHKPIPDVPMAELLGALSAEVESGRVGIIGCSNHSAAQLQEALNISEEQGYPRFEIVQPGYNLANRDCEADLLPLCMKEGIAVTPYSPLGAGFLAGKYTPDKSDLPAGTRYHIMPAHADVYFSDRNFRVVERLRVKAAELGVPMVRLAMAWAMTHPAITAVLVGAREPAHIDNALAAYEMGLDPDVRAHMSAWGDEKV
jgi:aryl-alcohol dehydrogenase-like predicted oxidoreductase